MRFKIRADKDCFAHDNGVFELDFISDKQERCARAGHRFAEELPGRSADGGAERLFLPSYSCGGINGAARMQ